MDARTARCLGVSSGMPMSFNPHRPMVHARSRYHMPQPPPQLQTVQQQQQQQRPMYTQRASSYDPYTVSRESLNSARATPQPQYHPSFTPITTSQNHFYSSSVTPTPNMAYTPLVTDIDSAYFSKCATPDSTLTTDMWDDALKVHNNSNGKSSDVDEFGLGLGSLGDNLSESTVKGPDNDFFNFPNFNDQADPISALEASSPDGHSWSTLSDASGGVISDFPDFSAEAELACLNSDFSLGLDSVMPSIEDTASVSVQNNIPKSTASSIARSSPSHRYRTSPYPSKPMRNRSFTTGSIAQSQRLSSPFAYNTYQTTNFASQHASPLSNQMSASQAAEVNTFFDDMNFDAGSLFMPSSIRDSHREVSRSNFSISAELDSNLPSSIAPKSKCEHSFAGSSEPPNLYGALNERPISPPPEDMNPENEDDTPRVQELRFEGDLYTPKYVRGHGNKREGWCGICKPGRWLVLKNSAFWYDKSFTHGISAATGAPFESPRETRRMKSNPDVWEGLCHSCGEWIALISSKKKGTTWFRHAYKCHTHQKVKDTPKRRREASHARAIKAAQNEETKCESRDDTPFSLDIAATDESPEQQQHQVLPPVLL